MPLLFATPYCHVISMITILPIPNNRKQYLDLLLLADEQENMIDRYIERGEMFALQEDGEIRAVCIVTCEGDGVYELKNIATLPQYQRQGYGRRLIEYLIGHYRKQCHTLLVGTGESPLTVSFYESCGFAYSHRIPNFFIDHYDHPIVEVGIQLKDMVYFKIEL